MPFKAELIINVYPGSSGDDVKSACKMTGSNSDIGLGLLMSMAKDPILELLVRAAVEMLDSDKGVALKKDLRK